MRRLILSVSALSLMGLTVGCVHTAGVCDCNGNGTAPAKVAAATKPEAIKEMPKETIKEKAELDTPEPPSPETPSDR
jgi:hypothetical protein